MDQEVFKVLVKLQNLLAQTKDEEGAVSSFVQEIRHLFSFDRFTLCFKEGNEGVIRHVYGQVDDFDRGTRFLLNEGLNGWIIKRNAPMIIADIEKGDYIRPRYFRDEYSKHGLRSFLGVPLGRGEEAWGCLSLESRLVNQYSEKGKDVLSLLAEYLYSTLERISLILQLRELGQGGNVSQSPRFRME
jgi:transcriptional regulator with GAF, ATPase, and Fis domain